MFRPNRIGTPIIHQSSTTTSSSATKPVVTSGSAQLLNGNVINAASAGTFQRSQLSWTPSAAPSILVGERVAIGQQFTITAPIAGNALGIELEGAVCAIQPNINLIQPFVCKITAAIGSLLGAYTALDSPTWLAQGINPTTVGNDPVWKNCWYKENLIFQDPTTVEGTYVHGFAFWPNASAAYNWYGGHYNFAVRQNMDQAGIEYTDTRR